MKDLGLDSLTILLLSFTIEKKFVFNFDGPPFTLNPPTYGLNSDYIAQQTDILQNKMKGLMEEFVRIDNKKEGLS